MMREIVKCCRCRNVHYRCDRSDMPDKKKGFRDFWTISSCPKCLGHSFTQPSEKEIEKFLENVRETKEVSTHESTR